MTKKFNSKLAGALFGGRGEAKIESTDSEKDFCVGMFQDGIYERRNTLIGSFVYKKNDIKTPYLTKEGESSFEYKLPKPPKGMLLAIAGFFREIMAEMRNSEVMVQIWWNKKKEEYSLYVPVQQVAGASIQFKHSEELQNDTDMVWIFDIHSHNNMGAFFSGTDSADEISTRVFGVLGKLGQQDFQSSWRAGVNGNFNKLELDDLWDDTDLETEQWKIPEDDKKKVTNLVRAVAQRVQPAKSATQAKGGVTRWVNRAVGYVGSTVNRSNKVDPSKYSGMIYGGMSQEEYESYMSHMASISHGGAQFDFFDSEEFTDGTLGVQMAAVQDHIEEMCVSEDQGVLGKTELADTARYLVDFVADRKPFDISTGQAILDQLSIHIKTDEFNELIKCYGE